MAYFFQEETVVARSLAAGWWVALGETLQTAAYVHGWNHLPPSKEE